MASWRSESAELVEESCHCVMSDESKLASSAKSWIGQTAIISSFFHLR